jgi:hypothetical protein
MNTLDSLILGFIFRDWMPSDMHRWYVEQYWILKN